MTGCVEVALDVVNPVVLGGPGGYPAPAGFRLLGALDDVARSLSLRLQITCGSNGHKVDDPHTLGEAYDIRAHKFEDEMKKAVVKAVLTSLAGKQGMDLPIEVSTGWATTKFFGFLEAAGTPNEHFHFQRRHGVVYP